MEENVIVQEPGVVETVEAQGRTQALYCGTESCGGKGAGRGERKGGKPDAGGLCAVSGQ